MANEYYQWWRNDQRRLVQFESSERRNINRAQICKRHKGKIITWEEEDFEEH